MNSRIIKMNSVQQNEFLVWNCLEKRQLGKVLMLLDRKMELTPFMLTSMVVLDYDDESIIKVLLRADDIHRDVVTWLENHFETDDLVEVFKHFNSKFFSNYPSKEDCVRLKLWDVLVYRRDYDVVAQNAPEVLEKLLKTDYSSSILTSLMKTDLQKYGKIALDNGYYGAILFVNGGWKYLFEHGKQAFVFSRMKNEYISSLLPEDEIIAYCREKGWLADMYKEGLYDILLDNEEFSFFIENHSVSAKFLLGYPNKVQWEDLWQYYRSDETYRNYLIEKARVCKDVPECKAFLKKHTGLFAFLHR